MGGRTIDGQMVRRARADVLARPGLSGRALARRLSDQMDGWFGALSAELPAGWSLIATGGYAGGMLCPGSDVDVTLVHPHRTPDDQVRAVAESLWYPVWDAGLKLSPSAHTVKSLLALAADDLVTATAILRVRCLGGDDAVATELVNGSLAQWRKRPRFWLDALFQACEERWEKAGEVASRLEPDLKDGRGGQRDYDAIRWALALDRDDIISELEVPLDELASPADVLLGVRCEMHRVTGRTSNTLLLQDQDAVAERIGYSDADVMMRALSDAANTIDWASERFWWRVERAKRLPSKGRRATSAVLADGVRVIDDEVHVNLADAEEDQSLSFRVAAAAAHAGFPISMKALRALSCTVVDEDETWSEGTRQAMVSLLGAGPALVPTVEALERYDLFSRMFPEWRHVRCLPQRNAFHTYTVDRHLLQTVINATEFVREVSRPDLLLVCALLHDIGKGYPDDHTEVGMRLVDTIARRMGFAPDDVEVLRAMCEHHLLIAETATRRDLSDPRTAENVASLVGDRLRLDLLECLTEADSLATGPSAWSAWKASLVRELCESVGELLAGRRPAPQEERVDERIDELVAAVRADPKVHTRVEHGAEFDTWMVATPDERGLFARIAGTLAVHGIDVVSAEVWTSPQGVAVDRFQVHRGKGGTVNWHRVDHDLRAVVAGDLDLHDKLAQRIRTYGRARRASAATPPRLEVILSNEASETTTMVDVRAPDAIAMLYRLASVLTEHGLDVRSAKVATLGHEVVDVFYVSRAGRSGASGKVPQRDHEPLKAALRAAFDEPS